MTVLYDPNYKLIIYGDQLDMFVYENPVTLRMTERCVCGGRGGGKLRMGQFFSILCTTFHPPPPSASPDKYAPAMSDKLKYF